MSGKTKTRVASEQGENPIGDESLIVQQRLRNLIKLAVEIGRQKGLLGNHHNDADPANPAEPEPVAGAKK